VAALLFLSLFFSLLFLLSHFVLHSWCLFIGFNDSSSCSFVNNGGCQTYQTLTLDNGCWLPPTTHHCSLLL
jgi:cell division protein FtsB